MLQQTTQNRAPAHRIAVDACLPAHMLAMDRGGPSRSPYDTQTGLGEAMSPKRATLRDIAQSLGLSVNTVSRAIAGKDSVSEQTRSLVLAEAERLRYVPNTLARSLVLGAAMTIGLVITNTSNPFYARLISSVALRARAQGYSLVLLVTDENAETEARVAESLLQLSVDGAIVVPVLHEAEHWVRLKDSGMPLVFVSREVPELQCDFVGVDNHRGAYEATAHLIEGGARSIWVLEEDLPIRTVADRIAGYRRAMADAGLRVDADSVISVPTRRQDSSLLPWEPEQAYRISQQILQRDDRPDAIIMGKDHFALGLYHALDELGMSALTDIAAVGYGDYSYAAYLHPPLSSVHVPAESVAETAVELLLQRTRGEGALEPQRILLQPELRVRESSSANPGRPTDS